MLRNLIAVGLGGATGSVFRYLVGLAFGERTFPYATLAVNIAGSFIIGMLFGFGIRNESFQANWKLFLTTGVCGGFTTFSAFSLENVQLMQHGRYMLAFGYIILSLVLGIGATFAGYQLVKT